MTDIFMMDDEGLSQQMDKFSVNDELNYRLIDDKDDKPEKDESFQEFYDKISDLPVPRAIPARKNSTGSRRYSSSYEININEPFVSSLNKLSPLVERSSLAKYKPRLSDFETIKVLGKGSYGKVLLVREISTGRLFAQKQLKKASLFINESPTREIHRANYNRTINEKTILEKVCHPNIVKLYYAFQDHNKLYLILEYLDGGELFHHLAQERFMSEKNSSYYIAQMIIALRYLHIDLKVIYRDLKPENCMLNADGNLVLTDFGLSKVSDDDSEGKNSIIGTCQYMAPEVLKGEDYGFLVDWWSLGCVAFDLLTGSPPFTGNNNKKIMDKILAAKKTLKFPFYLSQDAKDFLRKLLQTNPNKRIDIDNEFDKVKKHRFFRFVNWDHLENLSLLKYDILPPILPVITDPILAENFDDEFTEMPFTPPTPSVLIQNHTDDNKSDNLDPKAGLSGPSLGDILHIRGFSFTNESFLKDHFD